MCTHAKVLKMVNKRDDILKSKDKCHQTTFTYPMQYLDKCLYN